MNHVRNDQYTHLDRGCPMRTDLHPADDVVEVVLGEWRLGGTLRLVVDDPDMLLGFAEHSAKRAASSSGTCARRRTRTPRSPRWT